MYVQISALETALTFLQESQLPKVNAHMDLEVGDTIKVRLCALFSTFA